jgi:predicted  nucleic acid-binding Zn-ribbon protein
MTEKIENITTEQEHLAKRNQKTHEHLTRVKKNHAELTDNVEQNFRDLWEERTRLKRHLTSGQGQLLTTNTFA